MKAAVMYHVGEPFQIEELELAPPRMNEVKVKTVASGICHSDYSIAHGVLKVPTPVVLGHEGAGIVTELGPGVTDLLVGDHVIAALSPTCGQCDMCNEGRPYMCTEMMKANTYCAMPDGTTRLSKNGEPIHQLCAVASFAEEMVMPAGAAIKCDPDIALESACLIGCGGNYWSRRGYEYRQGKTRHQRCGDWLRRRRAFDYSRRTNSGCDHHHRHRPDGRKTPIGNAAWRYPHDRPF